MGRLYKSGQSWCFKRGMLLDEIFGRWQSISSGCWKLGLWTSRKRSFLAQVSEKPRKDVPALWSPYADDPYQFSTVNPWPSDPKFSDIGRWELLNAQKAIRGMTWKLFRTGLGMTPEEIENFVESVETDFHDLSIHGFFPL